MFWHQYPSGACFSVNTHRSLSRGEKVPVTGNQYETMFALTHVGALTTAMRAPPLSPAEVSIVHHLLTKRHLFKMNKERNK